MHSHRYTDGNMESASMSNQAAEAVRQHYDLIDGQARSLAGILAHLSALEGPLTPARLAPLDQFHSGGLPATRQLAERAGLTPGLLVLDAGSGFGGSARYLAETYGVNVAGIDLTPSFVHLATLLSERTGLADRVKCEVGDLLALPFPDAYFDLVWTQHVVMNIRDRPRLYREFRRVLRPGGTLVFHDLYAPDEKPPLHFPVPWAQTNATSFLLTKAETVDALHQAGFSGVWSDITEQSVAFFATPPPPSPDGLSLGLVLGSNFAERVVNIGRNLNEGRVRAVMGVYSAAELHP